MNTRFPILSGCLLLATIGLAQHGPSTNQKDTKGRKQGPWQRTWANSSQLRYVGQFKDDVPVGDFVYYSTEGKVESRIDHYPGSHASHGRHYHPNGMLMAEGRYVDEQKDSTWNFFDTDGKLRSVENWKTGKKDGEQITYFGDGSVAERKLFVQGVQNGVTQQFHPNGKLRYSANYVDGVEEGMVTYYFENGSKEIEGSMINGARDGGWTYYLEEGPIQIQVLYAQGEYVKVKKENGVFKEYYDDEQLKSEINYKNGLREGPFTEWFDNGRWVVKPISLGPVGEQVADSERVLEGQTKKSEGVYQNDSLQGTVKEYDINGRTVSTTNYVNGVATKGDQGQ